MEPQQARFTFLVFLSFTAAIVFNALFLQKDTGFRALENPVRPDLAELASLPAEGHRQARQVEGHELLRAVRRELARLNYFPGSNASRLDGRVDAMTMGAIMAYQYDHGLPVTGLVSNDLFKRLLFGVGKTADGRGKRPVFTRETRQLVAEIQGILSAKGYYDGKIDGLFAGQTSGAVRRFERDRGLPVTGRISGLLVQELSRLTGVGFMASHK